MIFTLLRRSSQDRRVSCFDFGPVAHGVLQINVVDVGSNRRIALDQQVKVIDPTSIEPPVQLELVRHFFFVGLANFVFSLTVAETNVSNQKLASKRVVRFF